jgi:transposase
MKRYSEDAWERTTKVQDVILRAMAKRVTWWQAAEIIGISDRCMRRWRERYQKYGYDGLLGWRRGKPNPNRVAVESVGKALRLYQEKYADLSPRPPALSRQLSGGTRYPSRAAASLLAALGSTQEIRAQRRPAAVAVNFHRYVLRTH